MKKLFLIVVLTALLLTACSQQATPTVTDSEMATKVAQILTNMPTATGQGPKVNTTTPGLPTVATTATQKAAATTQTTSSTAAPVATTAVAATATVAPSATVAMTPTVAPATATQPPAASATPAGPTTTPVPGDPRTGLGSATWTDAMDNGNNWPTGTDPAGFTSVDFKNGFMELTGLKAIDGWRLTFKQVGNVYLEMTVNSGKCLPMDRYGIIARVPNAAEANRGYMFTFTCDGKFAIRKWDGPANAMINLVNWKANSAIKSGADQVNRMGIKMQGNRLSLYANGVLLGEAQDSAWSAGVFGIFAGAHESNSYLLKVDEVSYWNLP